MRDVNRQIAAFSALLIDSQEPITEAEVETLLRERVDAADRPERATHPIGPGEVVRIDGPDRHDPSRSDGKRRSRGLLVATAAAAVVLVLLAVPLWLRTLDRSGSVAENVPPSEPVTTESTLPDAIAEPPPSTPSSTIATEPAPVVPVAPSVLDGDLVWQRIDGWSGPSPNWITEYPSGGFVASGFGIRAQYSKDGRVWTSEPFDDVFAGASDVFIEGRYALIDSTSDRTELNTPPTPWSGRGWLGGHWETLLEFDGEDWHAVELPAYVDATPLVNAPPVVSGGMVLVQIEHELHGGRYALSVDGEPFELFSGPPNGEPLLNLHQVFALPAGFGVYSEMGTLWTSADGIEWAEVADLRELATERPTGGPYTVVFTSTEGGAVGQVWYDSTAWRFIEGSTPQELEQPGAGVDGPAPRYMATIDGQLVLAALGETPLFWTSADAEDWSELPSPQPRPIQPEPERGRVAMTSSAFFYWYHTASGQVVMQMGHS